MAQPAAPTAGGWGVVKTANSGKLEDSPLVSSVSRKLKQFGELIGGERIVENCSECQLDHALESTINHEQLIITFGAAVSVSSGLIELSEPCGSGSFCSKEVPHLFLTLGLGK